MQFSSNPGLTTNLQRMPLDWVWTCSTEKPNKYRCDCRTKGICRDVSVSVIIIIFCERLVSRFGDFAGVTVSRVTGTLVARRVSRSPYVRVCRAFYRDHQTQEYDYVITNYSMNFIL